MKLNFRGNSSYIFSQGYFLYFFLFFCSFMVVWGLASWIGFWKSVFSVDSIKNSDRSVLSNFTTMLCGIELWGHVCDTDLKLVLIIQKATVSLKKNRENVWLQSLTCLIFCRLKCAFLKFCTLKLLLKQFQNEFLMSFRPKHS